jgi:hypothetical protein
LNKHFTKGLSCRPDDWLGLKLPFVIVEARENTSTETLRVVRGDEKGTQCPGVYLGDPVPGEYKYGNLALQVGGVSNETAKYYILAYCCTVLFNNFLG